MTNCRSLNGKICIQINHPALLHGGYSEKRIVFPFFAKKNLGNIVNTLRGNDYQFRILDSFCKKIGGRFVSEISKPCG